MNSETATTYITQSQLVPVIVSESATDAVPLAEALRVGGIRCAEITLRTPSALDTITAMGDVDNFCVGAGTVCNPKQVDDVVAAGAQFVVSPGFSEDVIQRCRHHDIALFPGVNTASEVMQARNSGLTTLKFFPANVAGGPAALKALSHPFPDVSFIPTGGITSSNMLDYLTLHNVLAVGGSWLTPRSAQTAGDWAQITQRASDACATINKAREKQ